MKRPLYLFFLTGLIFALTGLAGCNTSTKKKDYVPTVARFLMESDQADAFASITLPVSGVQIAVNNKPVITEFDITGVQLAQSDLGKFLVFSLTGDATRDIYRVSTTNQGRRLVLFINGQPVGARLIDRPFNSGTVAVFIAVPEETLPDLVKNLNATSADIQKQIAKNS
jgi:ABC-type phosphate transport system substrate-binding protein